MSCEELTGFLDDYLDGTLPLSARVAFEVHLAVCRDCRNYLDAYRRVVRAVKDTGQLDPVGAVPEQLVSAILAARKGLGE